MIRLARIAALLALAASGLARPAAAEPEKLEEMIWSMRSNIIMALVKKDVEQLEQWSQTYRTTRSRAPDGYWHLHHFHKILSELPVSKDRMDSIQSWEELVKLWRTRYPSSPTPAVVLAGRYYAQAWAARGSGTADQVFDDAWTLYRSNLDKSRLVLLEAQPGVDADPEWFARMAQIGVSLSDRKAQFMAIIEEGLKREPTYYKLYNVAFAYLLPRWHGSAEQAEAWAREAVERSRATEGDSIYARIYANHLKNADARKVIRAFDIDWPLMKRGIDELLTRNTEPELAFPLLGLSCAAKDAEQVIAVWKHLGAKFESFRHRPIDVAQACGWQPAAAPQPRPTPKPEIEAKAGTAHPRPMISNRPRPVRSNPQQFGPGQYISN